MAHIRSFRMFSLIGLAASMIWSGAVYAATFAYERASDLFGVFSWTGVETAKSIALDRLAHAVTVEIPDKAAAFKSWLSRLDLHAFWRGDGFDYGLVPK